MSTLLDSFIRIARNPSTTETPILHCGEDHWSYGDLDVISSGLALRIHAFRGSKPTVVVISENHPYMLAGLLATWKLDGIFAPLDPHAPIEMVKAMINNIVATVVIIPDSANVLRGLLDEMNTPYITFSSTSTTTTLLQQYLDQEPEISSHMYPPPRPTSLAVYLHTSSATSASNLKCVPLTHETLIRGSQGVISFLKKSWPTVHFDNFKILGMSPWSHIMGIIHDIGTTFQTCGCLILGVIPSGYPTSGLQPTMIEMDLLDRLLSTVLRVRPDIFIGVPWVLVGIRQKYFQLQAVGSPVASSIRDALRNFKCFGVAGAAVDEETLQWALDIGINLSHSIGMTELGAPLFHTRISTKADLDGWPVEDCVIEDAELSLIDVDDEGTKSGGERGELVVISKYIASGYLKYDSSAFEKYPDGRTKFRTGDVYEKTSNNRFIWKGRKEDYIQMATSETLDPRPLEKILNACTSVSNCAVSGNHFLKKASDYICIFIEPNFGEGERLSDKQVAEITKAIAAVNRSLLPPLRIAWSRVFILEKGMKIPYTRKGAVFRKKLEDIFGILLHNRETKNTEKPHPNLPFAIETAQDSLDGLPTVPADPDGMHRWQTLEVETSVSDVLSSVLGIQSKTINVNIETSFAEFGMDSNMAVQIVNKLNIIFGLDLPLNACHTWINLNQLVEAVCAKLGIKASRTGINIVLPESNLGNSSQIREDVVIVGQALRLPGDINSPESFWEALINKRKDIITDVPLERWDHASFYRSPTSTQQPRTGDILFERAGFIDVSHFDNSFFGISTPEALFVSPTTRLTLETVFEALENANIPASQLKGTKTAVFAAAGLNEDYNQLMFMERGYEAYNRFYGTGMATSTINGRISYLLDIHGPSMAIDTACSSGLVALDQAVKYIQSGDGNTAIVSAVNTNLWPGSFAFLSAQKMASINSRCATFSNMADGYVPSEASVAFVLKSRRAAIHDGDNILATIKASDVMHGGRSQGLIAPNVNTQISLQQSLLQKARLKPSEIDFIETHGTGTSLGDSIEIQGINEVFQGSHIGRPLFLGASKSWLGHTEIAAGLVGILSAVSSLKWGMVPGLAHLSKDSLNPQINTNLVPLNIPSELVPLFPKREGELHRAIVLSNGFSGTIGGVILEQSMIQPSGFQSLKADDNDERIPMLFVVSAKTWEGLEEYIRSYCKFCTAASPSQFRAICYTTCVGREHYRYRFACVAINMADLIRQLEVRIEYSHNVSHPVVPSRVAFAFPGQGSQFRGMASNLASHYPDFKDILNSASETATKLSGFRILSFLLDADIPSSNSKVTIDDSQVSQICLFVYQYSVAKWLSVSGVKPFAVVGSSIGEIAACVTAGGMSYELALDLVIKRAKMLRSTSPSGMAIVETSEESILALIQQLDITNKVVIAVYNGPNSHVVSGDLTAVDALLSSAKSQGLRGAKLKVGQGFHSPSISGNLRDLQAWCDMNRHSYSPLDIALFSTVYGAEIPEKTSLRASYWLEHARDPVRLSQAVQKLLSSRMADRLLDIGPQPLIWAAMQPFYKDKVIIPLSTKQPKNQALAFISAVALLFELGVTPDFRKLFSRGPMRFQKIPIPTYPFQRQHHYPKYLPSRNDDITVSLDLKQPLYRSRVVYFPIDRALYNLLTDHQIEGQRVAPAASIIDFFANQSLSKSVQSIVFHSPLVVSDPDIQVVGHIQENGSFSLNAAHSTGNRICTGTISEDNGRSSNITLSMGKLDNDCGPPEHTKTRAEVYDSFKHIYFGPSFQKIQEMRQWSTHVDIFIKVESTSHPTLDRIRKIDCCLHAMGGIAPSKPPLNPNSNGAFLPASLRSFTLHSQELPESFICRYYLPFTSSRSGQVMTIAFESFSLDGRKLISCEEYSVAWIPAGTVTYKEDSLNVVQSNVSEEIWFQQSWITLPMPDIQASLPPKLDPLLIFTFDMGDSPLKEYAFDNLAEAIHIFHFPNFYSGDPSKSYPEMLSGIFENALQKFQLNKKPQILLDLTPLNDLTGSASFAHSYRCVLHFMKFLSTSKVIIARFIIMSETSLPVDTNSGLPFDTTLEAKIHTAASLIQGMARVFRREHGLNHEVTALDLPNLDSVDNATLGKILFQELYCRGDSSYDHVVAYRHYANTGLSRLVPRLRAVEPAEQRWVRDAGICVIVGLGSIATALVPALISSGTSAVVCIGRRGPDDNEIQQTISYLQKNVGHRITYVQADICHHDSVRESFIEIQRCHGPIEHIIHTAAIIEDATIGNVDNDVFDRVLNPKVTGSWNLHLVSNELCPHLKSFVLLSSISFLTKVLTYTSLNSVSLGNPGQISYVAANSYMERLAAYRRQKGLPGTALQLGPWESKLTANHAVDQSIMKVMEHARGIPIILKAMNKEFSVVQVICELDRRQFATAPAYSEDPLFKEIIGQVSANGRTKYSRKGRSNLEVTDLLSAVLREVLELKPTERLELAESLTSYGIDSISFTQIKGRVMDELGVEVPIIFLDDAYSISTMFEHISRKFASNLGTL